MKITKINLLDLATHNENVIISNWNILKKSIPISIRKIIYQESNPYSLLNLDTYLKHRIDLHLDESLIKLNSYKGRRNNAISSVIQMNKSLGKVLGYLASEGSINEQTVTFSNTDILLLNDYKQNLLNVFPNVKLLETNKSCKSIILSSKIHSYILGNILFHKKSSYDMHFHKWFKYLNDDFMKGFLAAEIDGDGSISNSVTIASVSLKFLEQIQYWLSLKNIESTIKLTNKKGSKLIINNHVSYRNYDAYCLRINNKIIPWITDSFKMQRRM